MPQFNDNKVCFANHMGIYMVEPMIMTRLVNAIKAGVHPEIEAKDHPGRFEKINKKVALINIAGVMMKGVSKFGGTSTLEIRQQIRSAVKDSNIEKILLKIDSPGGSVAGTAELAEEVAKAAEMKFVHAHVEDLTASAAFWVASQANIITANKTAEIGSIGTFTVIEDTSGKAERDGVKVHVISTGDFKGAFAPGVPVTDEQLKDVQERVNALNDFFIADIVSGRRMEEKKVRALADGKMHIAEAAKALGLIDEVVQFDNVIESLISETTTSASRAEIADTLISLEAQKDID